MNIRPDDLAAIQQLGYTATEAQFLYLVATHSGYFTLRHFHTFTRYEKGCLVHRLTTRALERRHLRATEYGRKTHVYNLYSRRVYGAIGKDNLRNRRRQSNELIHTRLLILDFVLNHPGEAYLETEAQKVAHFNETLGLPLPVLPGRIYRGLKSAGNTKRYFIDRFPVFIPGPSNPFGLPPAVTLTYCDTGGPSLLPYVTHLRNYQNFLRRLPAFNFIYASPEPRKFDRARAFFERLFSDSGRVDGRRLLRYFELRMLWEGPRSGQLTRADRDFLRDAAEQYHGERFESAYRKWATAGLSMDEAKALLSPAESQPRRCFETYVLPESYDIFATEAARDYRTSPRDSRSIPRSISRSTDCEA